MSKQEAEKGADGSRAQSEAAIANMRANFHAEEAPDAPAPKNSLKKLILVAVALLLVGAAAGGAWMFLLQPPVEKAEIIEAPPEVYDRVYVKTAPVHIAFVRPDGRRRQLVVFMSLEVEGRGSNVSDVHQAMPRLQEAYWRTLNADPLPGSDTGAIELNAVKERVLAESGRLLGPNVVNDVLIRDARTVGG